MAETHSLDELLSFLDHAGDKGLMPAATAQALAVATRNVAEVLAEAERGDVRPLDLDAVVRRFQNKRARDFTTDTLKEYGRRFRRAVDLFTAWRDDPANFRVKTRATAAQRGRREKTQLPRERTDGGHAFATEAAENTPAGDAVTSAAGTYTTRVPVGRNRVVTLQIPDNLTKAEAEKVAKFVQFLPADA